MSKTKEEQLEFESLVLVSPSGHKYEVSVSDAGNLIVKYKPKGKEKAPDDKA